MDYEDGNEPVDIDTASFINSIKSHPCIWNYKSESYSNRIVRYNAWEAIAEKFTPNFCRATDQGKAEIASKLQKKWKHLRDGFNRYVSKCKKAKRGNPASQKRRYVFFKQLKFLMPLCEDRPLTSQLLKKHKTKASTPQQSPEASMFEKLSKHIDNKINSSNNNTESQDDDKMFLVSLCSDFRKIPDEYKLDAKSEILGIIKKYKNVGKPSQPDIVYHLRRTYTDASTGSISPSIQEEKCFSSPSNVSISSEDIKPFPIGTIDNEEDDF